MKKYALLMLIVLGTSTVAWAGPWASISVPPGVCSGQPVTITVGACLQGQYTCDQPVDWCVHGNLIIVDIHLTRVNACHDALQLCKDVNIMRLCPGTYSVVARIYVRDKGLCGKPGMYVMSAVGSTWFNVKCCNPCGSPFPWWF